MTEFDLGEMYDGPMDDTVAAFQDFYRPPRDGEIHGYCVGDRIAVVSDRGRINGLTGHVVHVSRGCDSHCFEKCPLVYAMLNDPTLPTADYLLPKHNASLRLSEVTHVD